jgi:integrase
MPEVFKKTLTRYWLKDAWIRPDGQSCPKGTPGARFVKARRVPAGTPGAVEVKEPTSKYYGRVPGKREPVPLCSNKRAAETMLSDLIGKSALRSRGLDDPYQEHRTRPLLQHLDDFLTALRAKDAGQRHIGEVGRLIRAFLAGVEAVLPGDLNLSDAQKWLSSLRQPRPTIELPPGVECFTRAEVAELLDVELYSIAPLVRSHQLSATGKGKARRFPRATVEALLADPRRAGPGPEMINHYIRAIRSFLNWMVNPARRLPGNPLEGLELVYADADRRRIRRELTTEELRQLLAAARASKWTFRGLDGEARFHLYATACGTGFRAGGLASLTPECFDLDGGLPVVTLPVRGDKSKHGKTQPLPADVADLMRTWLAGKPAGKPVWPGDWASSRRAAEMLRGDLTAAGIPYAVAGPDGPMYADFHALRHTYLTLGGRAGIDLRTLQELAGHSTPTLTARYTHIRLHDQAGAVQRLPGFLPAEEPGAESGTRQEPAQKQRRKA